MVKTGKVIVYNSSGEIIGVYTTIQEGVDVSPIGGTVSVLAGTYNEAIYINKGIALMGVGTPTINFPFGDAVTFGGNGADSTKIFGFIITGSNGNGIRCNDGADPTITNNAISGDNYGIACYSSSPDIYNNTISGNIYDGIWLSYSSPTITNNIISGNSYGIFSGILGGSPIITNNTISGNRYDGIDVSGNTTPKIHNNIITENGTTSTNSYGINNNSYFPGAPYIRYNNIWENGSGTSGNAYWNCFGLYDIYVDPQFISTLDFHLQPTSPCIDKGLNTAPAIPSKDKDGNPRIIDGDNDGIAMVDMGAYEYQVTPPPPQIGTITGTISYTGNKTGTICVVAREDFSEGEGPTLYTLISSAGTYTLIGTLGTYYVCAFMDSVPPYFFGTESPVNFGIEPFGIYKTFENQATVTLSASTLTLTNIDIELLDPATITLTKKADKQEYSPGEYCTYTITYSTGSTGYSYDFRIEDKLPQYLIYSTSTPTGTYYPATHTIIWDDSLGDNLQGTYTVVVYIPGIATPGTYTNIGTFSAENDDMLFTKATATTSIHIIAGNPATLTLSPENATITAGIGTASFFAYLTDKFGNPCTNTIYWNLSNQNGTATPQNGTATIIIATITQSGSYTLFASATTTASDSATIFVISGIPATITLSPPATITTGGTITIYATITDTYGNDTRKITYWTTTGGAFQFISSTTAIFTGTLTGTYTIIGTASTISAQTTITVIAGAVNSFELLVSPAQITIPTKGIFTLTIIPYDKYNNQTSYSGTARLTDLTNTLSPSTTTAINAEWKGSLTITKSLNEGISTITATSGAITGRATITVCLEPGVTQTIESDYGTVTLIETGSLTEDFIVIIKDAKGSVTATPLAIGVCIDVKMIGTLGTELHGSFTLLVAVPYNIASLGDINESTLKLYTFNGTIWELVPDSWVDTTNNIVYGTLTHLTLLAPLGSMTFAPNNNNAFCYPNPYKKGDSKQEGVGGCIRFTDISQGAIIKIYTITGELVKEIFVD